MLDKFCGGEAVSRLALSAAWSWPPSSQSQACNPPHRHET